MKRLSLIALSLVGLSACDEQPSDVNKLSSEVLNLDKGEVATVGKLPDGSTLKVTTVNLGWTVDRVYFTENSLTAVENCGKNCQVSVGGFRK